MADVKARNEKILQIMRENRDMLEIKKKRSNSRKELFVRICNQFQLDISVLYKFFKENQEKLEETTRFQDAQILKLEESDVYYEYLHYLWGKDNKAKTVKRAQDEIKRIFRRYEDEQGNTNIAPEFWTQRNLNKIRDRMKAGYYKYRGKKRSIGVRRFQNVLNNWGRTAQILKCAETGKYIRYDVPSKMGKKRKQELGIMRYVPPSEDDLIQSIDAIPNVFGITLEEVFYIEGLVTTLPNNFTQQDLEDLFVKEAIKRTKSKVSLRDYRDFQKIKNDRELEKRFALISSSAREIKHVFNEIINNEFFRLFKKSNRTPGLYVKTVKVLSHELAMRICATHGLRHGNQKKEVHILDDINGFDRDRGMKGLKFGNIFRDEEDKEEIVYFNVSDKYHERERDVFFPTTKLCYERLINLLPIEKKTQDMYVFKEVVEFDDFLLTLTEVSGIGVFKRDADGCIMRDELLHPIMQQGKYWYAHGLRKWFATTAFWDWGWTIDEIAIQGYWTSREVLIEDYIYGYKEKVLKDLKVKIRARYADGTRRI